MLGAFSQWTARMTQASPRFRIGIDTGGTFTDIVAVDAATGAMSVTKVSSTPSNPAIGLVRGVNVGRAGARYHGGHQRAAAGRHLLARADRHRRLPPSPGDRGRL
eukprot:gene54319-74416_t